MTIITSISQRGNMHPQRNEDNFFVKKVTENVIVGAVFDGCSTGTDSWFASKLFVKAFETELQSPYEDKLFDEYLRVVIYGTCFRISWLCQSKIISLVDMDLLSTMVVFIYDSVSKSLKVKFFGDGNMYIKEKTEVIQNDENNTPDYLGYHIYAGTTNDVTSFNKLYDSKREENRITSDFAISTDGIESFRRKGDTTIIDPIQYLVFDDLLKENPAGLKRKLNLLIRDGWQHEDDLTILRIINNGN
jgi:serine/threonine protein phosphatase PrpC